MRLLMLRSLLVATDLEGGSVPALRSAARLAELTDAELHLLHVAVAPVDDGVDRLREEFARSVPNGPDLVTVEVLHGVPDAAIVDQAARLGADAIVLGPHRRGDGRMGEMGSTAAAVVHNAPCPCLVAATELRLPLERILAPVDLSEVTGGSLAVAVTWASALRPRGASARITAFHVAGAAAADSDVRRLSEAVERARQHAGNAAHVEIRQETAVGSDPGEIILRQAATGHPDLLVIGTRGARGAGDGLGSVSATVARGAGCPLLLVPPTLSAALDRES